MVAASKVPTGGRPRRGRLARARWAAALCGLTLVSGLTGATQGAATASSPDAELAPAPGSVRGGTFRPVPLSTKGRPGLEAFASFHEALAGPVAARSLPRATLALHTGAAARVGQLPPSPLMTVTYALVRESDGNHPGAGAQIVLFFGTNGQADVYASNATEADTDSGTYSYNGGRLSLHIEAPDLKVNADFALDLSAPQVTMPFQIFSSKAGTSVWQQQPMPVDQGIQATYNAATNTDQTVSVEQAADQAYAYAQAYVSAQYLGSSTLGAALADRRGDLGPAHSSRVPCGNFCIASVVNLGDDIQVNYKNGQSIVVSLYDVGPACASAGGNACMSLSLSPLANDPRVFLDPTTHPDSEYDPPNKEAVFISPVADIEDPAALTDMANILGQRGYVVKKLLNSDATLDAIARLLKTSPGFLLVSTHGNTAGQLLTGQTVSTSGLFTADKLSNAKQALASELTSEGLESLTVFRPGGTPAYYIGEPNCSFKVIFGPEAKSCDWKVVVTPTFWQWAETDEGANFTHSFVFISACDTDATTSLRDAMKARAYFAFTQPVASNFATAVERYVVEALWRPSHSPEETFYNMLRVEKTHQMIYKEDDVLQGDLGDPGSDASFDIMNGWGWNGSTMVDYRSSGWLSGKVDAGQVWWMLYAARWSQNTTTGAANLKNCYAKYWSSGNPGGLASPYCNAANAGIPSDPTSLQVDVAYAIYLLNGTKPSGFSNDDLPPRWTLDD